MRMALGLALALPLAAAASEQAEPFGRPALPLRRALTEDEFNWVGGVTRTLVEALNRGRQLRQSGSCTIHSQGPKRSELGLLTRQGLVPSNWHAYLDCAAHGTLVMEFHARCPPASPDAHAGGDPDRAAAESGGSPRGVERGDDYHLQTAVLDGKTCQTLFAGETTAAPGKSDGPRAVLYPRCVEVRSYAFASLTEFVDPSPLVQALEDLPLPPPPARPPAPKQGRVATPAERRKAELSVYAFLIGMARPGTEVLVRSELSCDGPEARLAMEIPALAPEVLADTAQDFVRANEECGLFPEGATVRGKEVSVLPGREIEKVLAARRPRIGADTGGPVVATYTFSRLGFSPDLAQAIALGGEVDVLSVLSRKGDTWEILYESY